MYVGRVVAIGKTADGANVALYRVSSRSFPNRRTVEYPAKITVTPLEGHEHDVLVNPYIAYNAVRLVQDWAIVSNGAHTDLIAEKMERGFPARDAIASVLLSMDYEQDELLTPRIAAVVPVRGDNGWLGIVRVDAIVVKKVPLIEGQAKYIATYGANEIQDSQSSTFDARSASEAARYMVHGGVFQKFENPVLSAAALAGVQGFDIASYTAGF